MANLIRGLSENGGVVFCGVDSTELVRRAEQLHTTSATCSAALGRLLTGASLMGSMLKDDGDKVTLRVQPTPAWPKHRLNCRTPRPPWTPTARTPTCSPPAMPRRQKSTS